MRILFHILLAQFFAHLMRCAMLNALGQMSTTEISAEVDAFYDKTQIMPLRDAFVLGRFAQKKKIPKGAGNNVIRWNKWPVMPTQTIPLTEGVNPDPQKSVKSIVEATALLYGGYVEVTEDVDIYREDAVAAMYQERMGWQGADTLDELLREEVCGGTNVVRGAAVATRALVNSKMAIADLKRAARTLRNNKVPYFKKQIGGGSGIGTTPIQNSWVMVVHGDVQADMEDLATGIYTWKPVASYASQNEVDVNEVGALGPFRVIATTLGKVFNDLGAAVGGGWVSTTGSNNDVYGSLCFGPDAFGCVDVADGMKSIRKSNSEIGGPLELYGTIGWKTRFAPKRIDDLRLARVETCATA